MLFVILFVFVPVLILVQVINWTRKQRYEYETYGQFRDMREFPVGKKFTVGKDIYQIVGQEGHNFLVEVNGNQKSRFSEPAKRLKFLKD